MVVLTARTGLDTHNAGPSMCVHMLGTSDVQIAQLFQRRVALDTLVLAALFGALPALGLVALIGVQLRQLGSELLGGVVLGAGGWITLAALPLAFVALAALVARRAIVRRLGKTL